MHSFCILKSDGIDKLIGDMAGQDGGENLRDTAV